MALLDTDGCVLIVIDLQPGFYLNRGDVDGETFAAVVAGTARLVGLAAALSVPVVLTEEDPDVNGGTAAEVMERLPAGSPVLAKPVFDLSADDEIRAAVRRPGRGHAVLAGLETDVCVLHSAVGLIEHGFTVSAVVDALFSPGAAHQAGLERLRQHGVDLVTVKGVFYDWVRTPDAARRLRAEHPDLAPTAPRLER
ncbi:MAG TPA: isochorismatase family protein [Conexibacter sp.]|nr:isochorismatase family protein [Conexibacter sp.]